MGAIEEKEASGREESPERCRALILELGDRCTILDVRTREEFADGHLEGAVNLDLLSGELAAGIGDLPKDIPCVVYCRRGTRGRRAMEMLTSAGFSRVYNMSGGYEQWKAAGLPTRS